MAYWLRWAFVAAIIGLLLFIGAFVGLSGPAATATLDAKIANAARIAFGRWLIFVSILFVAILLYESFKSSHAKAPPPAKFARTPSSGTHLSTIVNRKSTAGDRTLD